MNETIYIPYTFSVLLQTEQSSHTAKTEAAYLMIMIRRALLLSALVVEAVVGFAPHSFQTTTRQTSLHLMDPSVAMDFMSSATTSLFASQDLLSAGESLWNSAGSDILTAFADQGQNLAGIFFQASLLPYLLFLYFLSFKANRIPATANFGFQFILVFVLSTIPSGILSKAAYGTSLANVDWLHGGAEALLTVANVLVVRGVKEKGIISCCVDIKALSTAW
jgi:hypothetical protein